MANSFPFAIRAPEIADRLEALELLAESVPPFINEITEGRYPRPNGFLNVKCAAAMIENTKPVEPTRIATIMDKQASSVIGDIALVPVGRGRFAIVDKQDLDLVSNFSWSLHLNEGQSRRYAQSVNKAAKATIRLHQLIASPSPGEVVDHINGDGLDNRRANLRLCSMAENLRNSVSRIGLSQYKGVSKNQQGWTSHIFTNGERYDLGTFAEEVDAAIAYDLAALKLFGEFAGTNFPRPILDRLAALLPTGPDKESPIGMSPIYRVYASQRGVFAAEITAAKCITQPAKCDQPSDMMTTICPTCANHDGECVCVTECNLGSRYERRGM